MKERVLLCVCKLTCSLSLFYTLCQDSDDEILVNKSKKSRKEKLKAAKADQSLKKDPVQYVSETGNCLTTYEG